MVAHSESMTNAVLSRLRPTGCGLEVAPYFDPFLHKRDHPGLCYTDYCSTEELLQKARQNPGYTEGALPPIDFVWRPGEALQACAPPGLRFEYAVASHVLEHVANPIGWLNDVLASMADGARLALFLPDRRSNGDRDRHLTSFGELVALWATQPSVPTATQVADFLANSISSLGPAELLAGKPGTSHYTDDDVLSLTRLVAETGHYLDVHCTVWEPLSFVAAIERASRMGLMNVEVSETIDDPLEFAVVLTKRGEPRHQPPALSPAAAEPPGIGALRNQLEQRMQELLFHQREAENNTLHRLNMLIDFAAELTRRSEPRDPTPEFEALRHLIETRSHEVLFHQREAGHNIIHRLDMLLGADRMPGPGAQSRPPER